MGICDECGSELKHKTIRGHVINCRVLGKIRVPGTFVVNKCINPDCDVFYWPSAQATIMYDSYNRIFEDAVRQLPIGDFVTFFDALKILNKNASQVERKDPLSRFNKRIISIKIGREILYYAPSVKTFKKKLDGRIFIGNKVKVKR